MSVWWLSLTTELQVFYGIAIVTTALLLLQLLLLVFGLDFDGDLDVDVDADLDLDGDGGVGLLSIRSVTAFFTGFGWGGVAALEGGSGLPVAILAALLAGGVFMLTVYAILRGFASMQETGTLDYRNAVGNVGTVYLPIPPNMEGAGQIEVRVQGRLRTVQAFTRADRRLGNGTRARVREVVDQSTLVVEPLEGGVTTERPISAQAQTRESQET